MEFSTYPRSILSVVDGSRFVQRVRWGNIVEVLVRWFSGTLAGTAGNEQDVTGLQHHVRSFCRQNFPKIYRNVNAAIFAFPDDLGLVQASRRVQPFCHRQYLQYRDRAGIPDTDTHGIVYVAHDVNGAAFGDHGWRLCSWDAWGCFA